MEAIKRLALRHGFAGTGEHLEVQGFCKTCAGALATQITTSKLMSRYCAV
jgi:hypothetical protein